MTTAHDFSGAEAFAPHRSVPRPPLTIVGHNESRQSGHSVPTAEPAISFGAFHLLPAQRLLLEADKPLPVDSRERPGEVVGKDELMARVWPNSLVEEDNLKVQVAALRKILGDGRPGRRYVVNVHGRGYLFVAPVRRKDSQRPTLHAAADRARNLAPRGTGKESAWLGFLFSLRRADNAIQICLSRQILGGSHVLHHQSQRNAPQRRC
jgi:DNA-binding winged helix-turn-helix (wHTH) protein